MAKQTKKATVTQKELLNATVRDAEWIHQRLLAIEAKLGIVTPEYPANE